LDTTILLSIWFKRFFSVCQDCGTLLNTGNAYKRQDTVNHLHAYCKLCYVQRQLVYNHASDIVKPQKKPSILIKVSGKKHRIYFDSQDDKQSYLRQRKSLAKFGKYPDSYCSRVGCTEDWLGPERPICDWCGGTLRYNVRGELECTECNLIFDTLPVPLDREMTFGQKNKGKSDKTSEQAGSYWSDQMDDGTFDRYFSTAYSKRLRK
jgi:hypothetical protein